MPSQPLSLSTYLYAFGVTFLVMAVLDGIWLGWLAIDFYKQELGPLMTDSIRIVPAAVYYLLYPAAILFLALSPPPASLGAAALRCAVLGLTAFGVYDMTNLSTLRGYSVKLALVDTAWGTFATTLGGSAAYAFVIGRAASS
jgi:uncharacterized membrane protein